jgi:hypothetical protein
MALSICRGRTTFLQLAPSCCTGTVRPKLLILVMTLIIGSCFRVAWEQFYGAGLFPDASTATRHYLGGPLRLHKRSGWNGLNVLDAWVKAPYFTRADVLLQHPFALIRGRQVDPATSPLRFWKDFKFVTSFYTSEDGKSGNQVTLPCNATWEGDTHALLLHCPLPRPLKFDETVTFNITEITQGLTVQDITVGVDAYDVWENRGTVAMCSSPLMNKGPYLAEWIEWHLMMGTEVHCFYPPNLVYAPHLRRLSVTNLVAFFRCHLVSISIFISMTRVAMI